MHALRRDFAETLIRLAQFFLVCVALWWASNASLAYDINLLVVVGGVLSRSWSCSTSP
jgi:hypothetical protein